MPLLELPSHRAPILLWLTQQWQAQELLLSLLLVESFSFLKKERALGLTCHLESITFADGHALGAAQLVALDSLSQSEAK